MAACETCGKEAEHPLEISFRSAIHVFDCYECAEKGLSARCECCGCRFIRRIGIASGLKACARCVTGALPLARCPRAC